LTDYFDTLLFAIADADYARLLRQLASFATHYAMPLITRRAAAFYDAPPIAMLIYAAIVYALCRRRCRRIDILFSPRRRCR